MKSAKGDRIRKDKKCNYFFVAMFVIIIFSGPAKAETGLHSYLSIETVFTAATSSNISLLLAIHSKIATKKNQ